MSVPLAAGAAAVLASIGAYLIYSSVAYGHRAIRPWRHHRRESAALRSGRWLSQAGLSEVSATEFVAAVAAMFVVGAAVAYLIFGAVAPALVAGVLAAGFPVSAYRRRRHTRIAESASAWPMLLEELRVRAGSLGRSIPQALFEAGRRAPAGWRPAFAAAEREWLLTTDFGRTVELLKSRLADPTADVVGETLMVAYEIGGTGLDAKLADLIEDRVLDLRDRKDAATRQAGVRFARRFVLLVPLGMALAGLSIGTGRSAYATPGGQIAVVIGLLSVAACWIWSGRLMRLPAPPRVFR
jgi:tight adherence protein B